MKPSSDVFSEVVARQRGRSRLRAATVTAGVAGLAAAGVIAYNLPGPAHSKTVSGTTNTAPSAAPTSQPRYYGDDSGGDDGSATIPSGSAAGGAAAGGAASSHATSGGS